MNFERQEKQRAEAWKRHTSTLPDAARTPAPYVDKDGADAEQPYAFCLPRRFASRNLLPDVREPALKMFRELGIKWHAEVDGGPTNHLVSSQVQCVNALGSMVSDPSRLVRALGETLGIAEVLEIEPGRFLTFEYIGPDDFFGEVKHGARVRGSRCTSVDAAFRHRAADGIVELVLLEWKYTERYAAREPVKVAERRSRYLGAFADADGPLRSDLLPFEALLDEPFYQLMRQQLLAHALETSHAEGAERVRVVHVAPSANLAYQRSLPRSIHREHGESVHAVWTKLLRRQDRFVSVDSQLFADPQVTSMDYVLRYDPGIVFDRTTLLAVLEAPDSLSIADALEFDGDVVLAPDGVDLILGGVGTGLLYPFHLSELYALSAELDLG